MIGKTLGHYQILDRLGEGGMGVVYRARDTRLGRDVAVKLLPESFASDPERVARFRQEARLLASLDHPHIAAIHGLEEADGARFLVMELVPGETLAGRIRRGPLPATEALSLCSQICDALAFAHDKGIIHRDLKPSNVAVTPEGKAKVLDFGLAKALAAEPGPAAADPSQSPTLTYRETGRGVILGTAAYMSPEQARGKPLDRRTDVWSFGCVLYEALTGKLAFHGETLSDTIARILEREPNWGALPPEAGGRIRLLLERCLRKDPLERLRDLWDARLEMNEALRRPAGAAGSGAAGPGRTSALVASGALAGLLAGAFAVRVLAPTPAPSPRPVTRVTVALPPEAPLNPPLRTLAVSLGGQKIAYVGRGSGGPQLYLREIGAFDAVPIAGTEGAESPFFSPDGRSLGFFADGKLKVVPVSGGTPVTLTDVTVSGGGTWTRRGTIIFSPSWYSGLSEIPSSGGTPRTLTTPDPSRGELGHWLPEVLPDGRLILYQVWLSESRPRVALLDLESGARRTLVEDGGLPHYAASGHLIYMREGTLMAAPLDPDALELTGPAVPLPDRVAGDPMAASAHFSLSTEGTLVYMSEDARARRLVWVDRQGSRSPALEAAKNFDDLSLSPDGTRLAVGLSEKGNFDIWIAELARGALTRLTNDPRFESTPLWAPDGARVAFRADTSRLDIFWVRADGSQPTELLYESEHDKAPDSWAHDGRALAFVDQDPETGLDIWVLTLVEKPRARPFLKSRFQEGSPRISPDGRWVAYVSDETGRAEVYVTSFPDPGGKVQVSTAGGVAPRWARNGSEIFFVEGRTMMAAAVRPGATFSADKPIKLFETAPTPGSALVESYDVAPDGRRFIMMEPKDQGAGLRQIHVVLNWFTELEARAPTGR